MVLERSVDVDVPVVTSFYYEMCPVYKSDDLSYPINPLTRNKITKLDLELEVRLGDSVSKRLFDDTKARMLNDYKVCTMTPWSCHLTISNVLQ